jgi:rubrerythrin
MISEYLVDPGIAEGAGLQEVLIAAMKREQYSVEFYNGLERAMTDGPGRQFCRKLILAEEGHKAKLEDLYENLFLKED